MAAPEALTAKQRRFVEEYCVDANAAAAARRAGYAKRSAKEIGYENLTKPHIRESIEARMDEFSMGAAETQARISQQARGSIAPFLTSVDGRLRLDLSSPEARERLHLIKRVRVRERVSDDGTRETEWELELHDAQQALRMVARARGLFSGENDRADARVGVLVVPQQSPVSGRGRRDK